ncbi:OTU domain-containing protein 1 [Elysia marginata]|uniref:OTU domain-containing protein 1 n=1 Tax=Elysia marginata TaxID=1093978 RepID=A0AAV4EBS5_9GAST|nr:OTU domain-containing protein 1 [Elysia marginata]
MDLGSTVVDSFMQFASCPIVYDGFRPAQIRRGTGIRYGKSTWAQPSSKERVIPIRFEQNSSKTSPVTENRSDRGNFASPIVVDDVLKDSVNPTKPERRSKTVEGRQPLREEVVDLSETPSVVCDILQPKGQTAISYTKGKWTIIPVHHLKEQQSKVSPKSEVPVHDSYEKHVSKEASLNLEVFEENAKYPHEVESATPSIASARCDLHSEINHQDLLPSKNFSTRRVGAREHYQTEQDVNPAPSYPVYGELKEKLSQENRKIDYIRGDGNCFFRALSKQLYGTENYHKAIRSLTVDIMATNRSFFQQFIDGGDVQAHIERMSEENTWATTCEIYAAATLLQRDVYMLTPDHSNTLYSWLLFKPLFSLPADSKSNNKKNDNAEGPASLPPHIKLDDSCYLTLCNTNGNHYDRVVPDHGGCNCFLPSPHLDGLSASVDLT